MDSSDLTSRLDAHQIFRRVLENARKELARSTLSLAISGLTAGLMMGLTATGLAVSRGVLGPGAWQEYASHLLYPLGFMVVIVGRAQLFTENTLYPVALVLEEKRHVANTARLWITVFVANIVGAALFSLLATRQGALLPEYSQELVALGQAAAAKPWSEIFWTGVFGGWIVALMAWMVSASRSTIAQLANIWILGLLLGLGKFAHCIATSTEIISAVWKGALPLSMYLYWLLPATLGNIAGGVALVSLLNFGQVRADHSAD